MKTIHIKPLNDIFSKPVRKIKRAIAKKAKENQKPILIDYREKNSLVPTELRKLEIPLELKELKVADYIVSGIAVERKTISDFISSMINRRLINQLQEMQQYKKKLLIVEGIDEQELYSDEADARLSAEAHKKVALPHFEEGARGKQGVSSQGIHPNSIRGFLLSIILKYEIPLIFTKNSKDTAIFLSLIHKKQDYESPLNPKKKTHNKKEQLQYILEGFQGIGPKNARKLLKEFKTLQEILNAPEEKLKELIGKKSESIILLRSLRY